MVNPIGLSGCQSFSSAVGSASQGHDAVSAASTFDLDPKLRGEELSLRLTELLSQVEKMTVEEAISLISSLLKRCHFEEMKKEDFDECRDKIVSLFSKILEHHFQIDSRFEFNKSFLEIVKAPAGSLELECEKVLFEAFQKTWSKIDPSYQMGALIIWILSMRMFWVNECLASTEKSQALAKNFVEHLVSIILSKQLEISEVERSLKGVSLRDFYYMAITDVMFFSCYFNEDPLLKETLLKLEGLRDKIFTSNLVQEFQIGLLWDNSSKHEQLIWELTPRLVGVHRYPLELNRALNVIDSFMSVSDKNPVYRRYQVLCSRWIKTMLERPIADLLKNTTANNWVFPMAFALQCYKVCQNFPELEGSIGIKLLENCLKEDQNLQKNVISMILFQRFGTWFLSQPNDDVKLSDEIYQDLQSLLLRSAPNDHIFWICKVCEALLRYDGTYLSQHSTRTHQGLTLGDLCHIGVTPSQFHQVIDKINIDQVVKGLELLIKYEECSKIALVCCRVALEKLSTPGLIQMQHLMVIGHSLIHMIEEIPVGNGLPHFLEGTFLLFLQCFTTQLPIFLHRDRFQPNEKLQGCILNIYLVLCRFQPKDLLETIKKLPFDSKIFQNIKNYKRNIPRQYIVLLIDIQILLLYSCCDLYISDQEDFNLFIKELPSSRIGEVLEFFTEWEVMGKIKDDGLDQILAACKEKLSKDDRCLSSLK